MDEYEKREEKNKRVGWIVSVGVQLILFALFYFIVAWKAPFPPIPEYGIELGFQTSSGASESASSTPQPVEEVSEASSEAAEEIEQVEESESAEVLEEVGAVEDANPVKDEPVEGQSEQSVDEAEQEVNEEVAVEKEELKETEEVIETEEEQTEIDDRAIYGNQGTNSGEEEGASLALAGWAWDFKPRPDDSSSEVGKIVYQIVVDEDGYLVKIETLTSTVSPTVERKYRQAVERLTFSKTSDYQPAPLSEGTLTFIIRSK